MTSATGWIGFSRSSSGPGGEPDAWGCANSVGGRNSPICSGIAFVYPTGLIHEYEHAA
jgi:hypothetical protein